jgi:hypothetical protein
MRLLKRESQQGQKPKLDKQRVLVALEKYLVPEQVASLRAITTDGATVPLPESGGPHVLHSATPRPSIRTQFRSTVIQPMQRRRWGLPSV